MSAAAVVFGLLCTGLGLLLLWVGATNLRAEVRRQQRCVQVPGSVVGSTWQRVGADPEGGRERYSFPVVRYTGPDGAEHEFTSDVGTGHPTAVGTPVTVLHDPTGQHPPQTAGLRSRALLPAVVLGLGAVAVPVGIGVLLAA